MASHAWLLAIALAGAPTLWAQAPGADQPSDLMREAQRLDRDGAGEQARAIFQRLIDSAPDAGARAAAQRRMAMSWAFEGDCQQVLRYETLVIDYWRTQERAEPQNAFYQEGEMANEVARVCLDAGDLATAEVMYRNGYEFGLKEPEPRTHPRSLWEYRLAHALGRLAARRGDKAEAQRQIAQSRRILDGDSAMASQQERFFPYLVGYVALFTGDLAGAEAALTQAVAMGANQRDPFMHCLLAMTYEKQGRTADARAMYDKAYALATAHNPPAAFARPYARQKLGLAEGTGGR